MALEGSLQDFGLADILQLIYFQRKTGVLTLESRIDRVRLLFIEGNIAGAESKRRIDDNRLGKILVKKKIIKEADLQQALEEQRSTGAKLGNILIRKDLVKKDIVQEILNSQITETVTQLFSWKQGTYEFAAQGIPQDKELPFSLDTQHLLMEGLRILDEWSLIKGKVTLDTVFKKKTESTSGMTDDEMEIFKYVDGENDVSTIIDLVARDSFEVSKTLVSLMDKGAIEPQIEAVHVDTETVVGGRKALPVYFRYSPHVAILLSVLISLILIFFQVYEGAKSFRAARQIEAIRFKISVYSLQKSVYPESLEIITDEKDPWGRAFIYRPSNNAFHILSAGRDGREGTADDIY